MSKQKGGELEHILTEKELTRHGHRFTQNRDNDDLEAPYSSGGYLRMMWEPWEGETGTTNSSYNGKITMTGESTPFYIMQPYYTVNRWIRIS